MANSSATHKEEDLIEVQAVMVSSVVTVATIQEHGSGICASKLFQKALRVRQPWTLWEWRTGQHRWFERGGEFEWSGCLVLSHPCDSYIPQHVGYSIKGRGEFGWCLVILHVSLSSEPENLDWRTWVDNMDMWECHSFQGQGTVKVQWHFNSLGDIFTWRGGSEIYSWTLHFAQFGSACHIFALVQLTKMTKRTIREKP